MNSTGGEGRSGPGRWLAVVFRLLVTVFFLLLILTLSRCSPPSLILRTTPTPATTTGHLQIDVKPHGAAVSVDGLRGGTTPAELTLPAGEHEVRIDQEGYESLVEVVSLTPGGEQVLSGELVPLPSSPIPIVTLKPTEEPESVVPLSDLVVEYGQIELESAGACDYASTQLGVRVWIRNAGGADAGPFVVEANGVQQSVPNGLAAGQSISLWFSGYVQSGENRISVDATAQVPESNEENNQASLMLPIPTLPPTCTPPPAALVAGPPTLRPPTATPVAPPATLLPPTPQPASVTLREGEETIPTYPYASYLHEGRNDQFNLPYAVLDRAAYDTSNPVPVSRTYRTVIVENGVLKLTFLPEVGGRLYEVVYRPTGHRVTYRNPVLKPSPWGPAEQGWWLAAGGIEWCLPVEEHGYEWGGPWQLSTFRDDKGVTVVLHDSNADDRVRAEIAVRLEAGVGYFTIRPLLENPTDAPINIKYWTNAMLAPGGQNAPSARLRFVLPEAVTAVTVHNRGDESLPGYNERMSWPIFSNVDMSRLGNWSRWLGFFEDPAVGEFMAVYDEGYDEGMVRVFPAATAQGAKGFGFGWKDPIPSSNWTDDGSSYVEVHGGLAPTFDKSVTLPRGGQLQWSETWYPVAGLGGLRYANGTAALNLTVSGSQAEVAVAVVRPWSGDLVLLLNGQERWRQGASLVPGLPYRGAVDLPDSPQTGRLTLRLEAADGVITAEYSTELELK